MTRADRDLMLAIWDAVVYGRESESVTSDQYGDLMDLFLAVWGRNLWFPTMVGHGL